MLVLLLADVVSPGRYQHSSSGPSVWLIVAVVGAVVAIGVALLVVLRSRRRARAGVTVAGEDPSGADRATEDERVP
jgi:hypothetical protein